MEFKHQLESIREERKEQSPEALVDDAKIHINELLFRLMPPKTTLADMEDLATAIYATIVTAWNDAV